MPGKRPKRNRVERKVYFYRVHAEQHPDGRPRRFNPRPVLEHINELPFTEDGRYLEASDGNAVSCWIDGQDRLRIANVRRSGLPRLERSGRLRSLRIPAQSGLAEETPVVFFPDNIVGVVFNFYGPRVSRLATYFAAKAEGVCPPVTFEVLLRQDILEQLKRLRDIRLFQLKIRGTRPAKGRGLVARRRTVARSR